MTDVSVAADPGALIGSQLPEFTVYVERGRISLFADVIGEPDPVYRDVAAARSAGHPDVPIPPTFLFSLELERPDPYRILRELDVDLRQVLHAEQRFVYHRMAYAGEELTFRPRFGDYYEKRDGALRFIVRDTSVARGGAPVAELRNTLVVRHRGHAHDDT